MQRVERFIKDTYRGLRADNKQQIKHGRRFNTRRQGLTHSPSGGASIYSHTHTGVVYFLHVRLFLFYVV